MDPVSQQQYGYYAEGEKNCKKNKKWNYVVDIRSHFFIFSFSWHRFIIL